MVFFVYICSPVPRITLRKRGLHAQLGEIDGNSRKLVIKKFSRLDAGKYKCKAAAPSGRPVSRSTYVRMEGILLLRSQSKMFEKWPERLF